MLGVALSSPPARSAIKAVGLILDILPSPLRPLRALTPDPQMTTIQLGDTQADVYQPRGLSFAPSLVLVHGAAPGGKDDPRLRGLAVALARSGRKVIVPDLALKEQRLDIRDASRIRRAVAIAAGRSTAGVLAFSYGAALTLVALAEQPPVQDKVNFVATVGTFFDLSNLIQGVTTGTVPYRGRQIPWTPHPRAKELLPGQFAALLGDSEGRSLLSALKREDLEGLTAGTASVYELLKNRDPARVAALEAALPPELKALLNRLSPATVANRLRVPLFALHSDNDPASPPTESKLLVESLQPRLEARLYEVSFLQHVDATRSPFANLKEGTGIIRFAARILGAQEGWPHP